MSARPASATNILVRRAAKYFEEALAQRSMPRVDEFARRVGMSRHVVRRRFRDAEGYSIVRFFRLRQIEEARRLLLESDLPIKEIAYRVGFQTPEAFAKAFQREASMSPRQYRKVKRALDR